MEYWHTFLNGYQGYANYLWNEITQPHAKSYFYWLLFVSLFFFALEVISPWRKQQAVFRRDFWLDFFYMFFNFFLFSLIIYNALSDVVVKGLNDLIISLFNFDLQAVNPLRNLPMWAILLVGFVVRDFVQWWTHRLLHSHPRLWEFHKVHHSVEEMGFAAHLRYHWMETIVYRTIEYLPLALWGIGLYDFFIIHLFTLAVGHFNHSNITVPGWASGGVVGALIGVAASVQAFDINLFSNVLWYESLLIVALFTGLGMLLLGPIMKKLFNHPEMHIWHHAKTLPKDHATGVNFGISLAIWDYLFGTVYMPKDGRDIPLGFEGVEEFPHDFKGQFLHGLRQSKP